MSHRLLLLLTLAAPLLSACTAPAAAGLSDDDANHVVVALERAGVDGTREADPEAEGRYRVLVAHQDLSRAASVLHDEELPAKLSPGLLDAMGKGSLVPSSAVEHAQMLVGLSGELERTLTAIDGVISVRVHISTPQPDPLGDRQAPKRASASVLLKHRGATPPVDPVSVQRLVAGAVSGMSPDDVAVVLLSRPQPSASIEKQLAHVGPITVTRSSLPALRALLAASLTLTVLPTAALIGLWLRRRSPKESP